MTTVGVRELKSKLSHYLSRVRSGERITITDRGRPIAVIEPAEQSEVERRAWAMVREGLASWSGGKPKIPERPIKLRGKPLSEMIIEDREDRV